MRAIKMRLDSVWRGEFDGKKDSNWRSDCMSKKMKKESMPYCRIEYRRQIASIILKDE